ncbi:hypothetical protein [Streptomyces sp. MP131-18]|uniref:hypothetical protein n=1 Tax=Streptomyces sp. MP131-18 TaxID=1857892 RepID=UPI00097C6F8A|nr:hypothetical protein [Streptomyces sp. MP131-18]ONK13709.1 hypothetical protein STBA_44820 [Streptomyces sp. MP131-18]
MGPAHFHAYHWQGERRVFDQEADRRPAAAPGAPPAPGFLANPCTPLRISDWLLRPAAAVARTCGTAAEAAAWFRQESERAAPAFAVERERQAVPALAGRSAARLAAGGDVHAGWYLRGTGFLTLDVIGCSPNGTAPSLPCPLGA